jgi:hypothetical protein
MRLPTIIKKAMKTKRNFKREYGDVYCIGIFKEAPNPTNNGLDILLGDSSGQELACFEIEDIIAEDWELV